MKITSLLKNVLYAVLLGVSMAACLSQHDDHPVQREAPESAEMTPAAAPAPSNFRIDKGHVGAVRIGMPITDLRQQVPAGLAIADTTLLQEGNAATAYLLRAQNATEGILVEQACEPTCHVWRITVRNAQYKTAKDIRIGSTYQQVQQAYPISYVSTGEGNFVAVSKAAGLSFVLDQSQLPQHKLASLTPADVPASTRVKAILVY
ncbi:mechanosensitive ion channel protein MscS [Pontibacter chitinilyticus]|uniref:mechanosensitive ion channel protein MscS n=1 Tax=Pontibacter chitinilyticus TaxID=2674989 RepID=UPI00321A1161